MRRTDELTKYFAMVNAFDFLDASTNELMMWLNDDNKQEIDLSIFGKPAKARLYVKENERCAVILFDQFHAFDREIEVMEDTMGLAKRIIAYLKNPEDQF